MTDESKTPEEAKDDVVKDEEPKADDAKSGDTKSDAPEEPSAAEKVLAEPSAAEKVLAEAEPKAEEPKAEEPKAEEPKAEEPKAEEPKAEEPKAEEPKAEEPKAEEPKAEEPKAEEPKAEEPKAEEPKAEEPKDDDGGDGDDGDGDDDDGAPSEPNETLGFLIEFETEEGLKSGCASVRDAGYSNWDAHTPYPVHGLDEAMGVRPTILPWIVFFGGLTGCLAGLGLQLYTNGIELPFSVTGVLGALVDPFLPSGYGFVVSGKPVFSVQANIPVVFELTILLSAFGSFFGMWGLNRLPQFHHPVFHSERFRRASQDRYFISIEATDPLFDRDRTLALAQRLGGTHLEELVEAEE
jgi:hypothetical protein